MPQPLPPNPYQPGSTYFNAYEICTYFEGLPAVPTHESLTLAPLVCARLLGFMIVHAPSVSGRDNIAQEIISCRDHGKFCDLAQYYVDHFLRCFRASKGHTPVPSHHPSRQSFDNIQQMLGSLIQESPTDYSTAKLQSLARDGYRCLITGHYDMTSYDKYSEIQQIVNMHGYTLVATEAGHIFPPSTNAGITGNNEGGPKYQYAASVWAVIERFGGLLITNELNGADIHRLENIITMDVNLHRKFDRLAIWLEADSMNQHSYYVRGKDAAYTRGLPLMVTFTSTNPAFALPDPRYLHIHAACARVANLSGAGEYVDKIFRDIEDTRVLASNGSSADMLSYALTHGSKIEVF